ncbi:ZIP family metal transporter [Mycobacterium spongiae]|uniref:ZIP family metal transporter n=1 Tax=Mycobacterium spongiae TaxID=886343 RepID=A0A975JVG0_9MYCO|nr:ZIP family metal transporter [Mycobacterium spongiae]QUR66065.1 ZIP family metal transporter [Mycobacterium spongiae]
MSNVTTAAALAVFPVLAASLGGAVAVVRRPSAALVSGVQHFAAGVVMAALAGEVLPDLRERGPLWLIVVGFTAGVALLVWFRQFEDHGDHEEAHQGDGADHDENHGAGRLPIGFLAVVGVDLFIDGLLVATGATVSTRTAIIITIALTVEVLFLGLAVALRLTGSGVPRTRAAVTTAGVSTLTAAGAVLGAVALAWTGPAVLTFVLAFAAAALLWLVVEELLVEAHETPERPWMAVMFFAGFLILYSLGVLE